MQDRFILKKQTVKYLPINKIKQSAFSSRSIFDGEELEKLAESIKKNGLLVPISVKREQDGFYSVLSGERRLRASILNGVKNIECICFEKVKNEQIYSLIENIERRDLHFFEFAETVEKIIKSNEMSQGEIANYLNITQGALSNKLRVLKLGEDDKKKIVENSLSERHARALLNLPSNLRAEVLEVIIAKNLTVSSTEKLIEKLKNPTQEPSKPPILGDIRLFQNSFTRIVSTLCKTGVNAVSSKNETAEYIEYTVRIPKPKPQIIPFGAYSKNE